VPIATSTEAKSRDGPRNRDLTFFEDPGLNERLGWVFSTYGLPRVDIIENIILDNLPILEKSILQNVVGAQRINGEVFVLGWRSNPLG
jgi:hypothetical protein